MPTPDPCTLRLRVYWSYANLAMAHAAVSKSATSYGRVHYMIRAKLYKGLHTGAMNIGSLLDDERVKMKYPKTCAYCGDATTLTLDHLLPKSFGGWDSADNAVWACRPCNSSKGSKDALAWYQTKYEEAAPLLLIRRYLKLVLLIGDERGLLNEEIVDLPTLPFDPNAIPMTYPKPKTCRLWAGVTL